MTLTERQVDTLLAVVAHYRIYETPVPRAKLMRFLHGYKGVLDAHLYRLIRQRLVNETKTGFVPTTEGELFAIGCRYVGERNFGHTIMSIYAPA